MTSDATIDYDSLQQEALRGVVRSVLQQVAKTGLPGDHHLYISFDVRAPGVVLSKRLREKYPSEMTIVLQYRFWDLSLTDERFEVKLTFDGIPERLVVPFNAIKVFIDPSVRYVLHFEDPNAAGTEDNLNPLEGDSAGIRPNGARPGQPKRPRPPRPRPRAERDGASPPGLSAVPSSTLPPSVPAAKPPALAPSKAPAATRQLEATPATEDGSTQAGQPPVNPGTGGQVVSLDAFRKK